MNKRTIEQNNLMWSMLTDISKQVTWHGLKYAKEDWKDIISATINNQRMVPSIDGQGVVLLGVRTRDQEIKWFIDMITSCIAFGDLHQVKFKLLPDYEDYPELKR